MPRYACLVRRTGQIESWREWRQKSRPEPIDTRKKKESRASSDRTLSVIQCPTLLVFPVKHLGSRSLGLRSNCVSAWGRWRPTHRCTRSWPVAATAPLMLYHGHRDTIRREGSRAAASVPDKACVPRPTTATLKESEHRSRNQSGPRRQNPMRPYRLSPIELSELVGHRQLDRQPMRRGTVGYGADDPTQPGEVRQLGPADRGFPGLSRQSW
jgi:hypothetical protein